MPHRKNFYFRFFSPAFTTSYITIPSYMKSNLTLAWTGVLFVMLLANDAKAQFSNWFSSNYPIPTVAIQSPTPIGPSTNSWKLVFDDEFVGTSVDRTKWETKFNSPSPNDRAKPYEGPVVFNDQNVTVANGYATIQVREETNPVPYGGNSGRFTGGLLITKDIPSQRFNQGRFEIRCRFPIDAQRQWLGHALWPAFWLIGGECGREEIDVFELNDSQVPYGAPLNYPNSDRGLVLTTLHGIAGGIYDPNKNVTCDNCIGATPSPSTFNTGYTNLVDGNFHTFAVEWEPACITWFIDGNPVKTHYRFYDAAGRTLGCSVPAGQNFQHPMWPFHDLQVVVDMKLGNEANNDPIGRAPANLDIDYVRVYQRIADNDPRNLCKNSVINGDNAICLGQQTTFTVDNLPSNASIQQWIIDPVGAVTPVGSSTGSAFTVEASSSGGSSFTVQAILNNDPNTNCGSNNPTKRVYIGTPSEPIIQESSYPDCNYARVDYEILNFDQSFNYTISNKVGVNGPLYPRQYFSMTGKLGGGGRFNLTASNKCGNNTSTRYVNFPSCLDNSSSFTYSVSPNPATDEVVVSKHSDSSQIARKEDLVFQVTSISDGIITVYIYDNYGRLCMTQRGHDNSSLKLRVNELPIGLYTIQIMHNELTTKRQKLQIIH